MTSTTGGGLMSEHINIIREVLKEGLPYDAWARGSDALDALKAEADAVQDFRAEIAAEAFTAPDASWETILDSLRARLVDLLACNADLKTDLVEQQGKYEVVKYENPLKAENTRLREALEAITDRTARVPTAEFEGCVPFVFNTARAALAPSTDTPPTPRGLMIEQGTSTHNHGGTFRPPKSPSTDTPEPLTTAEAQAYREGFHDGQGATDTPERCPHPDCEDGILKWSVNRDTPCDWPGHTEQEEK